MEEEHYFNLNDAKDKAIHLLYAGFVCGYFSQTKDECREEFGNEVTEQAIKEFEENYMNNCSVIE